MHGENIMRGATVALALLFFATETTAEKSVAEEILDVLHAQGSITDEQYESWMARARDEATRSEARSGPSVEAGDDEEVDWIDWKDGLVLRPNEDVEIGLGGRVYADWAYFDADDDTVDFFGNGDLQGGSGTEFSRARIYIKGQLYDLARFKASWDFGTGTARARDLYIEIPRIPFLGSVRGGHFKEPYTLERLTSSKHILFMERALTNTFALNRNMGIALYNNAFDQRMTWQLGGFLEVQDEGAFAFSDSNIHNLTGRVTGLPIVSDDGRQLLHLGLSYTHRFVGGDLRYQSKSESNLAPVFYVDTGPFEANHVDQFNPEIALIWGPFSLQTEYSVAIVDAEDSGDPVFDALYVQAGWFVTGEHRPYDRANGFFGKVRPRRNFDLKGGWGALQLAFRYSWVDVRNGAFRELSFDPPRGRRLDDFTVAANWHLNPYMRLMFNYIRSDLSDVGATNIIQSRMQFDF